MNPVLNHRHSALRRSGEKNTLGSSKYSMLSSFPVMPQGAVMSQCVNIPSGISTVYSGSDVSSASSLHSCTVKLTAICVQNFVCPFSPG